MDKFTYVDWIIIIISIIASLIILYNSYLNIKDKFK